jgi:hypothetical protein
VYSLINVGVTDATINKNPEVVTEQYIGNASGTSFVERYAPTMPVEMTANSDDAVYEYVENLSRTLATLDTAETDMVHVYYWETSTTGGYPATKFDVSISVDTEGGPGGTAYRLGFTINFMGDPTQGAFLPSTLAFTAT